MRINTNVTALNTLNQLNRNTNNVAGAMERLSSGLRITRAADDAAGLSISEGMRAQVRGLNQAAYNAQDGISMIQTAEGALNEIHTILQRQRELTIQAANGTNNSEARNSIADEIEQLRNEYARIMEDTEFNGHRILDGNTGTFTLQVGANSGQTTIVNFNFGNTTGILLMQGQIITEIREGNIRPDHSRLFDVMIGGISRRRSELGAVQNRLEHTISNLNTSSENLSNAESRIRDADMAQEMMEMTRNNILQQASQAMLSQANQESQSVLRLLN